MRSQIRKFVFITFVVLFGSWCYCLFSPSIMQKDGVVFYLRPGLSKVELISELKIQGILRYPAAFSLFLLPQANVQLKTGEYLFPERSSLFSIWRQMVKGKGFYLRAFIIVPGVTFQQIRQQLSQTDSLRHKAAKMTNQEVMALMGCPQLSPEGQFFPETYYYTRGIQDIVILKRAFDLMQSRLQDAWERRAPGLPYKTPYEALIAASMVEKEAYLNGERPIIASVIINRLRKNMILQIDPTVIYGLGDRYTGKLHKSDLRVDTPYNTYLHKGLPPTPIAMPGMSSIEAVMRPINSQYYYFVARGDGSHQFSASLAEHDVAVTAAKKNKVPASTNTVLAPNMSKGL